MLGGGAGDLAGSTSHRDSPGPPSDLGPRPCPAFPLDPEKAKVRGTRQAARRRGRSGGGVQEMWATVSSRSTSDPGTGLEARGSHLGVSQCCPHAARPPCCRALVTVLVW